MPRKSIYITGYYYIAGRMKLNVIELKVFGIVQGVGFRPYVYRLAASFIL